MTIEDTRLRRSAAGRAGAAAANAKREPGRSALAARWAHLHDETLTAAAEEFGVAIASVSEAWERNYPGQSAVISKRAKYERSHPEDEVTL